MTGELAIDQLPQILSRVQAALRVRRVEIDDLNVFPVPDGDTGTNLVLTAKAVADEVATIDATDHDALAAAVVRGALMGARGNSGVIASQVFRAFAEVLRDGNTGTTALASALARARTLAYEAVAQPVEGTILTAISAAAEAAAACRGRGCPLADALTEVLAATTTAVKQTTDQLEVLRAAGVVDAGARGFEVFIEALRDHVHGLPYDASAAPLPVASDQPEHRPAPPSAPHGELTYRFEVQYLLTADESVAAELRTRLGRIGDSVVVTAAAGLANVHVHTDDVGGAIEAGLAFGQASRIEVTYFPDQIADHDAEVLRRHALDTARDRAPRQLAALGVVAVLPGPGLRALAEELGAVVVAGAAGALPSVATILNAVGEVAAKRVLVLPGHPNVVPTARMATEVAVSEGGRPLDVLDGADAPPSVLAALAVCDRDGEPEAVIAAMRAAAEACTCVEVVPAVRDATTSLGPVREGQALGVIDGAVVAVDDDPVATLRALSVAVEVAAAEILTLITGEDVDGDERARAEAVLRELAPDADVQVIVGGMRPARYFLGVE